MPPQLTLQAVRQARIARDPDLADRVADLAGAPDERPRTPVRDGAPDFWALRRQLGDRRFMKGDADGLRAYRISQWAAVEAPDAEVPAPERLGLHDELLALWSANDAYSRDQLMRIIGTVPLRWGPWRALKRIFKEAEAQQDYATFGALAARFDHAYAAGHAGPEVSRRTLGYLVRRAWRTLRRLGESLPAVYADAAVGVLQAYPEHTQWRRTWIANHLFYHGTGEYSRGRFRMRRRPSTMLKYRAFAELWRRSPRPLFNLLEMARSEQARRFATDALRADFRTSLRGVEPAWVERLAYVPSAVVHAFMIWLLGNVPRFEQAAFRDLGLHDAVLALLGSPSDPARAYAAAYARTHARDLDLEQLIGHAENDHADVRAMARDLLRARDPREAVGLEAWGRLLGGGHAHDFAAKALREHFTARELTPAWFTERLISGQRSVVDFAAELLPRLHPDKTLGAGFYRDLLDHPELGRRAARFALDRLERFPATDALTVEFVQRALLNPISAGRAQGWLAEERVKPEALGAEWLKIVADARLFARSDWLTALKASPRPWARDLEFDPSLAALALQLLSDVRRFTPDQLGFGWLMTLVQRTEAREHDFAVEYMTKAFVPADFAPNEAGDAAEAAEGEIDVDLEGASFLFTGKLATMTRGEAKKKVTTANGTNVSGVSGKLDYLVIGDEGSALYGGGRKGSKQVKAEKLAADGAGIRIISETAFLQMLAGTVRTADDGANTAGLETLWAMLTDDGPADAPLARFARHYVLRHHEEICPALTDRYVDPGAEIPKSFLTFERIAGLLADARRPLRLFGLQLARWELARLAPPMAELVTLSELPHLEVRAFVTEALTAEDVPENRHFRVDPATLTADAVYRFCESLDAGTRALGMRLIGDHPRLAIPEELFRLTESPDRTVRAFVVRQLWRLYRDRGISTRWQAPVREGEATVAVSRPDAPPAPVDDVRGFLRRTLFGIPPARLPKKGDGPRLRPLPARRAKAALIEVVRDLALEDQGFAERVSPLLREFLRSRGRGERMACLVALTRIQQRWPDSEVA